jgi:hypothetical protein
MAADRLCPSRSRGDAFDDSAFMPAGAANADRSAHPIARDDERQEDRRALPFGDAVALRAKTLNDEFDPLGRCLRGSCRSARPLH